MNHLAWIPFLFATPPGVPGIESHALQQAQPIQDAAAKDAGSQIVAKVGEIEITRAELKQEVNRLIPATFFHSRVPADRLAEFERRAVENLVERALILQDARARDLKVEQAELRAEFAKTLAKAGPEYQEISEERFDELLEQYRDLVVRRVLLDKNEARFEKSVPPVEEEALRNAYEARRESLLTPEQAHFLHILLRVDPAASSAEARVTHEETKALHAQLAQGASFAELAREHSEDVFAKVGGDMGFVTRGSFMDGAVDKAAFALADGATSDVITSMYGFHIVHRVESRPQRTLSFDECREGLRETLQEETRVKARGLWLDELRERYGVSLHLEE